jgi:hypothetical protein
MAVARHPEVDRTGHGIDARPGPGSRGTRAAGAVQPTARVGAVPRGRAPLAGSSVRGAGPAEAVSPTGACTDAGGPGGATPPPGSSSHSGLGSMNLAAERVSEPRPDRPPVGSAHRNLAQRRPTGASRQPSRAVLVQRTDPVRQQPSQARRRALVAPIVQSPLREISGSAQRPAPWPRRPAGASARRVPTRHRPLARATSLRCGAQVPCDATAPQARAHHAPPRRGRATGPQSRSPRPDTPAVGGRPLRHARGTAVRHNFACAATSHYTRHGRCCRGQFSMIEGGQFSVTPNTCPRREVMG